MEDEITMNSANPVPLGDSALPSFESCMIAASSIEKSGIHALNALSDPLQEKCPDLAGILRSSAIRTASKHTRDKMPKPLDSRRTL
jgi:hypothetical protein